MKKILLFISIFFFQITFSQFITFECNNTIISVSWEEITNNPNAYIDWDEDGDIDEDDALIYLYQTYNCSPSIGDCEEYITIVYDCSPCLDNQEIIFWEEINELNCEISQMCECVSINYDLNWNDIDWLDPNWDDFDWETVWSDYDLGNLVDWDNIPWGDIMDLNIFPDDLITYIQNIIALGQGFNWEDFVASMQGGEDCCINPAWIDPMAMCTMQWDPVVGCDGYTYSNNCVAEAAGVSIYTDNMGNETVLEWDCNQGGVDCVDDPEGILAQYSYQCNDIVGDWFLWDCSDDLSVAVSGVPSGMWIISDLCPQSCTDCGEEEECIAQLIPDCMFMTVIDPVCGCDGVTYSNSGEAACNNIFDFTMGTCLEQYLDCTLSDGTIVPSGWSGSGVGNNWCNSCFCDNGMLSCTEIFCGSEIEGCTDTEACNYNLDATIDDDSCDYGVECFISPCSISLSPFPSANCVDDYCEGCCAIWTWTNDDGFDFSFNSCNDQYIEGCMDETAINYNSNAIVDDGSCIYGNSNLQEANIFEIDIYPNPNNGSFNIVLNKEQGQFNIIIFNTLGKVIYTESVNNYVENSIKTIDLGFKKGTYIVSLEVNSSFVKVPMIIK